MDNLFRKGSPPPRWLRKLPLQCCMQESQVAVVIIVAKPSQSLSLKDTNCNRSEPRLALTQPGRLWPFEDGDPLCSVSPGCAALGFAFQMQTVGL